MDGRVRSNPAVSRASPWRKWAILAVVMAALAYIFPPVRVVRLEPVAVGSTGLASGAFDARATAEKIWDEKLAAAAKFAVDGATLIAALERDPKAAAQRHVRRVGLGGMAYYFMTAEGRISAVDREGVHVEVGGRPRAAFVLETGAVFGNAVRDGTGVVDVNAFTNSQDFNALAAALNALVEARVQPLLRERAKVGATIRFTGCAEVGEIGGDPRLLRVIPIRAEVIE